MYGTTYGRVHIYKHIDKISIELISVGLALARPNNIMCTEDFEDLATAFIKRLSSIDQVLTERERKRERERERESEERASTVCHIIITPK